MNDDPMSGRRYFIVALWIAAGLFALGAHAGALAWVMTEKPAEAAVMDVAQSAIMIELAPEPEAVEVNAQEIAPDDQVAEEVIEEVEEFPEPVEHEILEEVIEEIVREVAEEIPLEEPVEEVIEVASIEPKLEPEPELIEPRLVDIPMPAPIKDQVVEEVAKIAPPVPVARLKRPEPKKDKPKRKAQKKAPKKQSAAPTKTARKAQAKVKKSNRTAALQSSKGVSASRTTPAKWMSRLAAHLERRKRYPSGSRHRGGEIVYVRFKVDGAGNLGSIKLARSSGNAKLDKAALDTVRRASPVPAPPPGVKRTITAPIRFNKR